MNAALEHPDTEAPDVEPESSQWWYERVLGVVRYNTGGPQRATVQEHTVLQIATRCWGDADTVRSAIQAGVQNNDLVRFNDRSLATCDEPSLRAVATEAAEQDPPNKHRVAWCYQLIDALQEDTDE